MLFKVVIFIFTIIAQTFAKWPNRENDTLIYIANPIEANLPGHWVPLSIVKEILGGSTTDANPTQITSKENKSKIATEESTVAEDTTTDVMTTSLASTTETISHPLESTTDITSLSEISNLDTTDPEQKLTATSDTSQEPAPSEDATNPLTTDQESPTAASELPTTIAESPTTLATDAAPTNTEAPGPTKQKPKRKTDVTDVHDNFNN